MEGWGKIESGLYTCLTTDFFFKGKKHISEIESRQLQDKARLGRRVCLTWDLNVGHTQSVMYTHDFLERGSQIVFDVVTHSTTVGRFGIHYWKE